MPNFRKYVLLILSAAFFSGASGLAGDYVYSYRTKVVKGSLSCDEEAKQLASRFEKATRGKVVSSVCLGSQDFKEEADSYSVYSLALQYSAKEEFSKYSAQYGSLGGSTELGIYKGLYDNLQSCSEKLSDHVAEFTKFTKLKPISATCVKAYSAGFLPQIDGFGNPKMRLATFDPLHVYNEAYTPALGAEIRDFVIRSGAQVVGMNRSRVYFYAGEGQSLHSQKFGTFPSMEMCNSQIGDLQTILKNAKATEGFPTCISVTYGTGQNAKSSYYLIGMWNFGHYLTSTHEYDQYDTYDQCLKDRPNVLHRYKLNGNEVYGGLCLADHSHFGLEIFHP